MGCTIAREKKLNGINDRGDYGVHRDTQLTNIPLQGLNRHNYTDGGNNIMSLLADLEPYIDTISPV